MNKFNENKNFEEKMTPYIDKIYKKHMGNDIKIFRSTKKIKQIKHFLLIGIWQ